MKSIENLHQRKCNDCGVKPGKLHLPGCDVERCRLCGGQAISCDCIYKINLIDVSTMEEKHPDIYGSGPTKAMEKKFDSIIEKKGGRLPWTGEWPGTAECREFGWYSKWSDSKGWVRCEKDDPDAGPDLNRLQPFAGEAIWDWKQGRFLKRETL